MRFPKSFTTVTPLSKMLAIVLFILFPLLGFFCGVKHNQLVLLSEKEPLNNTKELRNANKVRLFPSPINIYPTSLIPTLTITGAVKENKFSGINCNTISKNNLSEDYNTEPASRIPWCIVIVKNFKSDKDYISGYKLQYPDTWFFEFVGYTGTSMAFNRKLYRPDQDLLVLVIPTNLNLESSDKEIEYTQGWHPIVKPEELVVSRDIQSIGNKQCLILLTKLNSQTIKRYFFLYKNINGQTLYMFATMMDTSEYDSDITKQKIRIIEEMVASMEFLN